MGREDSFSEPGGQQSDFSGRIAPLLSRTECRLASSSESRQAIFHLRYQAYKRAGRIPADSLTTLADPFDVMGNVYLLGMYCDDKLASSIRLHVATEGRPISPSLEVFPDVLRPELDAGKTIIDCTRFVADENFARRYSGLPYATLRLCILAAEQFNADLLLMTSGAEHRIFYQRAFNYRPRSEPRPYSHVAKPMTLMALNFPTASAQLHQRYPFLNSTSLERNRVFTRPVGGQPASKVN
jgi:N-acyl-L-homoserine lactone synthetase